ncbi:MAG: NnrU family protein [Sphingomonadaceae bacterium]
MTILILGLMIFLGIHSIQIVSPRIRARATYRLGEKTWIGLYSAISFVGLVLIIIGYGETRANPHFLFFPPPLFKIAAVFLMLPVFPLIFAAYLPGRIKEAVPHPMLTGVLLWSLAHLIAVGTSASLVLSGSFLVWSTLDILSYRWRAERAVPGASPGRYNDLIAIIAGLLVYALMIGGLHDWLLGSSYCANTAGAITCVVPANL